MASPITGASGVDLHQLLVGDSSAVIYGCGIEGILCLRAIIRLGYPPSQIYLYDSHHIPKNPYFDSVKRLQSLDALHSIGANGHPINLFLALPKKHHHAIRLSIESSFPKVDLTFLPLRQIKRPEAELSVNSADSISTGLSSIRFESILSFLSNEYPDLWLLNILGDPDPLLNPSLPTIIAVAERSIPVRVTSSIDSDSLSSLTAVITSSPTAFVYKPTLKHIEDFSLNGTSSHLYQVLRKISQAQSSCSTIFRVLLDASIRTTATQLYQTLLNTIAELQLKFVESVDYPNSYDILFETLTQDYDLTSTTVTTLQSQLGWDLPFYLSKASDHRQRPCLCQRIFPVINADGSIQICHLYKKPLLSKSLEVSTRSSLEASRVYHQHCKECQQLGLHRLDKSVIDAIEN